MIDLDAYLQRIAWTGPLAPTPDTLRGLAAAHAAAIAFENLDPLRGWPVSLDPTVLERKLVYEGRGGYCFEQNGLFGAVLEALGFEVTGLAARVLWMQPEAALTPRSHMLLRVEIGTRSHLVDVGFGGITLTGALTLEADVVQSTPHEPFRLLENDGEWRMQAQVGGEWKTLYRFDLQRQHAVDYELANHYTATHPRSRFTSGLIAARSAPERRITLRNTVFSVHRLDGGTERRTMRGAAALRELLEREFLIRLPTDPRLDQRLENLPEST